MDREHRPCSPPLIAAAVVLFLIHALNYLYFFVDDEAIPFVFARHLLRGDGIVYNSFEGRVEGYSDFLQVLLAAAGLGILNTLRIYRIQLFTIGKVISLFGGMATVWMTCRLMNRLPEVRRIGAVSGLAFIALAGPLAVWSCSSLEMSRVAFLTIALFAAARAGTSSGDRWALVAAILLLLERIDGPVYIAAPLGAAIVTADRGRRREMLVTIAAPIIAATAAYHVWRVWYFGEILTAPIYSKILYKLIAVQRAIVNAPARPYGVALLDTYGFWPATIAVVALVAAAARLRPARPYLIAAVLLAAYPSVVGDWMAGFRFFMPMLPFVAVLIALSVSSIRNAATARTVAAALVVWFGFAAVGFAKNYDSLEYRESWLRHPSFDRERFFGPYYALWQEARGTIHAGERTALNQAGFLPFMMDLENIDNLGICSKFFAKLPTTDVIFTEVGRFSPLTNSASFRAADAYLLYREPRFVIGRTDNLRNHNAGHLPEEILDSRYRLRFVDSNDENAVYERTAEPVERFKTDSHAFLENVAHITSLLDASIDGVRVRPEEYRQRLSMLVAGNTDVDFSASKVFEVRFADTDVPLYELHAENIWSRLAAGAEFTLFSGNGAVAHRTVLDVPADSPRGLLQRFPSVVRANRLVIRLASASKLPGRAILTDVRVQGQTPRLERYIAQTLRFPAPQRAASSMQPATMRAMAASPASLR